MAEELGAAEAWEAIALAENAVAYAYGVAGPALEPGRRAEARALYQAHEQARDEALLAAGEAVELPAFFDLPEPVRGPAEAVRLLALVESRLAESYADLVAAAPPADRQRGLDGVLRATSNALRWGAAPGPWGARLQER